MDDIFSLKINISKITTAYSLPKIEYSLKKEGFKFKYKNINKKIKKKMMVSISIA